MGDHLQTGKTSQYVTNHPGTVKMSISFLAEYNNKWQRRHYSCLQADLWLIKIIAKHPNVRFCTVTSKHKIK